MQTGYRGRCPLCSGELIMGSPNVVCANNDYEASLTDYEGRWENYEESIVIMTEVLLEDLKSYNKKGEKK